MHESFVWFYFWHKLSQQSQSIFKLYLFFAYQVSKDEGGCTTLASDWVNQYFTRLTGGSSMPSFINEPICDAEVFLCIFVVCIVYLHIQILEVLPTLHVFFACHVQNMSDSDIDKFLGFKSRLVRSHDNARVHFKQVNLTQSILTLNLASTHIHVWESSTDYVVFFSCVIPISLIVLFLMGTCSYRPLRWMSGLFVVVTRR